MKTYETTLHQVEILTDIKKNFSKLNPFLISRSIEKIKSDLLENKMSVEGLQQLEAPGNLIDVRDNLLIEIDLMLIEGKNRSFQEQDNKTNKTGIITFESLFETKYIPRINNLITLLKRIEWIDENEQLIVNPIIDFARLFYYLIEKKVIQKRYDSTKGVKVFFNHFGYNVVEKKNENEFCIVRGNITGFNAKSTDLLDNSIKDEIDKHIL